MYTKIEIEEKILLYFAGESSGDDLIAISNWLKSDEKNKLRFLEIKEYWECDNAETLKIDYDAVFEKISSQIKPAERRSRKKILLRALNYAAVLALVVGSFLYIHSLGFTKENHLYSFISTSAISEFELPDGTEITLNKKSELQYSNLFDKKTRKINLEGEAYVKVAKNEEKPFIINLGETEILVLGTSFNVKNKPNEDIISITLIEGSLKFNYQKDRGIVLKPNQELLYSKANNTIRIKRADIAQALAWKEKTIRYKSRTLQEATKLLEEHYNVVIQIADSQLSNEYVTGAFYEGLTVDEILNIINKTVHFKTKKTDENTYILSK